MPLASSRKRLAHATRTSIAGGRASTCTTHVQLGGLRSSSYWSSWRSSARSWRCCCRQFKQPANRRAAASAKTTCARSASRSHAYHTMHATFPVGCIEKQSATRPAARQLSWNAWLLPFVEEQPLWDELHFDAAYNSTENTSAAATLLPIFLCPSTVRLAPAREGSYVVDSGPPEDPHLAAATDYGGNYGTNVSPTLNGVLIYDKPIKLGDITDGASHTLLAIEDTGRDGTMDGEWINGENIFDVRTFVNRQQHDEIWSDHPSGAMVLWCDGGAALLNDDTEMLVLQSICTRSQNDMNHVPRQP